MKSEVKSTATSKRLGNTALAHRWSRANECWWAQSNARSAWSCFLIERLVTGYQAWLNMKPLSMWKLFVYIRIGIVCSTKRFIYPYFKSHSGVPRKSMPWPVSMLCSATDDFSGLSRRMSFVFLHLATVVVPLSPTQWKTFLEALMYSLSSQLKQLLTRKGFIIFTRPESFTLYHTVQFKVTLNPTLILFHSLSYMFRSYSQIITRLRILTIMEGKMCPLCSRIYYGI
jgi:hypothetical protein